MNRVFKLLIVAFFVLLFAASTASGASTTIEAEKMTLSGAAYPYPNALWASGRSMIYMTGAGSASDTRSYNGKLTSFSVTANSYKASSCSTTNPRMQASIDGTTYIDQYVSPGQLRAFTATLPSLPAGSHTLKVSYVSGPACYHELHVDKVNVVDDGTGIPPPDPGSCDTCQLFSVPAYWDGSNSTLFSQVAAKSYAEGKGASAMEIVNGGNGPGSSYNATLDAAIKTAQSHGIKVIGYVNTSAAAGTRDTTPRRPLADVNAEVDRWYSWYAVDGIFEDNSGQRSDTDTWHKSVYDHIKQSAGTSGAAPDGHYLTSKHDYVVTNISWNFNEYKMNTADIVVTFEDTYSYYTSGAWDTMFVAYSPFLTSGKYGPERFMQIIEGTPYSSLPNAITLSKQRNAGWVDVDNDVQGYNNLPTDPYWSDEHALLLKSK